MHGVRVANAPCTFGVFDAVPSTNILAGLTGPDAMLDVLKDSGYDGIDLGPFGYLGSPNEMSRRLREHSLGLAGGWLEFHFNDADQFSADLETLDTKIETYLAGIGDLDERFFPKPTLADAGSETRWAHPGGRSADVPLALSAQEWDAFAERVEQVAARVVAHGLTPTFHHHACTYVETVEEIRELLARTTVGLCLDSGHILMGGGDPVDAAREWGDRINHVHVKDCKLAIVEDVISKRGSMEDIWRARAFCRIGSGDLDVAAYLNELTDLDYTGWIVIEQDLMPDTESTFESVSADQRANREFLADHGF